MPEATARISLPGTGEQLFLAGALERSPITLRGSLRRAGGAKKVQAQVSIAGTRATLWLPVP